MDLDNSSNVIEYYLIIRMMAYLDHQNKFLMVSTLMCMITNWIATMVNYDIDYQVVMIY